MSDEVMLASKVDTFNFHPGQPMRWTRGGRIVRMTRIERAIAAVSAKWVSATRWWRSRTVVTAIDHERGAITLCTERWSWRHWRWERS